MTSPKDQPSTPDRERTQDASGVTEAVKKSEAHQGKAETQKKVSKPTMSESEQKEVEALRRSLQEEKDKAEQYLTSLKYLKAEFENYQKRTAKEMDELVKRGSERLARKLLGLVDDFERTIKASRAVGEQSKLLTGVEMILKELLKTLRSEGISKIETVGKKFDPSLHEAVMVTRTNDSPPETVVEELRPGYMFDGRVIRPAMVAVAGVPEAKSRSATGNKEDSEGKREPRSA